MSESVAVNVGNFTRAESNRMLAAMQAEAGGVNRLAHRREPADIAHQTVIRMNRDTLYSFVVVDLGAGAVLTLPDAGDRYMSAMVVSQDHYINDVFHGAGEHAISQERTGTRYALVAVRILVDPADPADVAVVGSLQDRISLAAGSSETFVCPDYDAESLADTRNALLELAKGLANFDAAFGPADQVDPVAHLLGTAAGWGGLPSREAIYLNVDPGLPNGTYSVTVKDVPVDGFWSISVYNREGFFAPNDRGVYSVNSVTGVRDDDGAITVHLGDWEDGTPNCVPLPDGWNYAVRLYRPRQEIHDGSWSFPSFA